MCVSADRIDQTVDIVKHTVSIEEKGIKMRLTIIDTPGFGDAINNTEWWGHQYVPAVLFSNLLDTHVTQCCYGGTSALLDMVEIWSNDRLQGHKPEFNSWHHMRTLLFWNSSHMKQFSARFVVSLIASVMYFRQLGTNRRLHRPAVWTVLQRWERVKQKEHPGQQSPLLPLLHLSVQPRVSWKQVLLMKLN